MDYDDWLFDSIKRYDKLSMYDLRYHVTAMDWVQETGIVVATVSDEKDKYEVMELLLPDKILNTDTKLNKDRDFRVHTGGFCDKMVEALKFIPNSRHCVVSRKGENRIEIWMMGDDSSELIRQVQGKTIDVGLASLGSRKVLSNVAEKKIIAWTTGRNLTEIDLETFKAVRSLDFTDILDTYNRQQETVSDIVYDNSTTVLACTQHGHLLEYDLRDPKTCKYHHNNIESPTFYWKMAASKNHVVQVSSDGNVCVRKLSNTDNALSFSIETEMSAEGERNKEHLCVQCSSHGEKFSVSGLSGKVSVYDIPAVDHTTSSVIHADFVHDGHVMNSDQSENVTVTNHLWFPWQPRGILSAASDGSLHAWQYKT